MQGYGIDPGNKKKVDGESQIKYDSIPAGEYAHNHAYSTLYDEWMQNNTRKVVFSML